MAKKKATRKPTARKSAAPARKAAAKKKAAAAKAAAPAGRLGDREDLDCFVIIGFGMKTDFSTGRVLNLDKTYTRLIKPAFDKVGVNCFRAIDVNRSGSIDEIMYHWIYQADLVVCDLSTLNANVFYELGVRHAQKPNTTIVMAEAELLKKIPFDLGHTVIHQYEHLGEDISPKETRRFVKHLSDLVQSILDSPIERDSPVYTYLRGMEPPRYRPLEERLAELEGLRGEADAEAVMEQSLAMVVDSAEAAKSASDFPTAIALFKTGVEQNPTDHFLRQRLALVTYKNKEKSESDEEAIAALKEAEAILEYCKPDISTDPETLGLSGAINKRLYDRTGEIEYFDRSIAFYERGFYVKQDYYNGINVAYMYTLKSNMADNDFDAIVYYGHANLIRRKVAEVCDKLIASDSFEDRGDKEWVYQTLAQAYLGMDEEEKAEKLMPTIQAVSRGTFDMTTFRDQNKRLIEEMEKFKSRVRMPGGAAEGEAGAPAAVPAAGGGEIQGVTEAAVTRATVAQGTVTGPGVLTIDLGAQGRRPMKSVEISCRVEY